MAVIAQNDILNLAVINEKLRRRVKDNQFWKPFISNAKVLGSEDNGQKMYQPSGNIIDRMESPVPEGRDNAILTMSNYYEGDPLYGDTQAVGTGESYSFNHLRIFVNQVRKVGKARSGKMSEIRSKTYKIYEDCMPQLQDYFTRVNNSHYTQAILEGSSLNVTAGLSIAKNGIGLTKRLHSNMYACGASSAITAIGTESKSTTVAELQAVVDVDASITALTVKAIQQAALKCQELKISQAITWKGQNLWLWVISPYDLYNLRQDDNWKSNERAFVNGSRDPENPLVNGAVSVFEGFMFYVDFLAVRAWHASYGFAGASGWLNRSEGDTDKKNNATLILGRGALGVNDAEKLHMKMEKNDFDSDVEIAGIEVTGVARNDYVASADESTVFAKGNATSTYLSSAVDIVNTNSLIVLTDPTSI